MKIMKLILQVNFFCEGSGGGYLGFMRKEYQSEVTPLVGMEIEDSAWFGPRRVNSVVLNLEKNYCLVTLEDKKLEKTEDLQKARKKFKKQGWKEG